MIDQPCRRQLASYLWKPNPNWSSGMSPKRRTSSCSVTLEIAAALSRKYRKSIECQWVLHRMLSNFLSKGALRRKPRKSPFWPRMVRIKGNISIKAFFKTPCTFFTPPKPFLLFTPCMLIHLKSFEVTAEPGQENSPRVSPAGPVSPLKAATRWLVRYYRSSSTRRKIFHWYQYHRLNPCQRLLHSVK